MRLELAISLSPDGDPVLRVMLSSDSDPGEPEFAGRAATAAFDELAAELPGPLDGEDVYLKEGHVVTYPGPRGSFRRPIPVVRDAVERLSRTGAMPDAGPPFLGGERPDGEWLYSRRTGRWRLEADVPAK